MKKSTAIRIAVSWLSSNMGFALISYACYKLQWAEDHTFYKLMFMNGIYFCLGSFVNMITLLAVL